MELFQQSMQKLVGKTKISQSKHKMSVLFNRSCALSSSWRRKYHSTPLGASDSLV